LRRAAVTEGKEEPKITREAEPDQCACMAFASAPFRLHLNDHSNAAQVLKRHGTVGDDRVTPSLQVLADTK